MSSFCWNWWFFMKIDLSQPPGGVGSSSLDMLEIFICFLNFWDENKFSDFFSMKIFWLQKKISDILIFSKSIVKKKHKKSVILKMIFCSNFFFRQYFSTRFFLNHKYSSWNVQKWGRIGKIVIFVDSCSRNVDFTDPTSF